MSKDKTQHEVEEVASAEEPIGNLNADFSEVEWSVASVNAVTRNFDYGKLEATQLLMSGTALEVPITTETSRLYRWLKKAGFTLRKSKKTEKGILVIWAEPIIEPTYSNAD
jgi:hypothetical protein